LRYLISQAKHSRARQPAPLRGSAVLRGKWTKPFSIMAFVPISRLILSSGRRRHVPRKQGAKLRSKRRFWLPADRERREGELRPHVRPSPQFPSVSASPGTMGSRQGARLQLVLRSSGRGSSVLAIASCTFAARVNSRLSSESRCRTASSRYRRARKRCWAAVKTRRRCFPDRRSLAIARRSLPSIYLFLKM
jgi:hypothetical protein